jgi:hypothetical protein
MFKFMRFHEIWWELGYFGVPTLGWLNVYWLLEPSRDGMIAGTSWAQGYLRRELYNNSCNVDDSEAAACCGWCSRSGMFGWYG